MNAFWNWRKPTIITKMTRSSTGNSRSFWNEYAGRPSRLYYAAHMTEDLGGAKVYLKREDLNHTGAHKINNVLGQVLLAKKMGKTRVSQRQSRSCMVWQQLPQLP